MLSKAEMRNFTRESAESVKKGLVATIVAAVDDTKYGEAVFDFVAKSFNLPNTKLVFVHVTSPQQGKVEAGEKSNPVDVYLERAKALRGGVKCEGRKLIGDPKQELPAFCKYLLPDAFVVGFQDKKGLNRLLMGSLSDYYQQHCSCPVVVVRLEEQGKARA